MTRHELTQPFGAHPARTEVKLLTHAPDLSLWRVRVVGSRDVLDNVPLASLGVIEDFQRAMRPKAPERKERPAMPKPAPKSNQAAPDAVTSRPPPARP